MNSKSRTRIKVFVVDDHPTVRDGVRAFLNTQRTIAVVGDAGDDVEALRKLKKVAADVILLDINLPGADGGELARRLRQNKPTAKLIAFSIHSSPEYVVRMARCGVHGYVMKDEPTAHLVQAIERVHAGGLSFPAAMTDAILAPAAKAAATDAPAALTARELEVLVLLAEGLANKEVARKLGISVRTAETHREHLSRKLGIAPIAGLTKYAIQHGLTSLSLPVSPKP